MALNTRIVTVRCYHSDGTPWADGTVTYTLIEDSFTSGGTAPKDTIVDTTDDDGMASTSLWTNAEGLLATSYRYTLPDGSSGTFVLPTGETPIALETLRRAQLQSPGWEQLDLENLMETLRTDLLATLRNTSNPVLGDFLLGFRATGTGAVGRTVDSKLGDIVNLADYGAIGDDTTNLGAAITLALAAVPAGTTLKLTPSTTQYLWTGTVTWDKANITLDLRDCTIRFGDTTSKIKAMATGGHILGGRMSYRPTGAVHGSGALFARKDPAAGDTALNLTGWVIDGCWFENITVRFQKMGRISVRIPLVLTTLNGAMSAGANSFTVVSGAALATAQHVRILMTNGTAETHPITGIVGNVVTISGTFTDGAPSGRRATGVTVTTAGYTGGETVVDVNDTAVFTEDLYAYFMRTDGTAHTSQITEIISATQVRLATAITGTIASGATVSPVNGGELPTGTDFQGRVAILNCEFAHYRGNYALELGGITDGYVVNCYFHDLVRYDDDVLDARFYTEYVFTQAEVNVNQGEAIKITAGSYRCHVTHCEFTRLGRNGIDMFSGGGGSITFNDFHDMISPSVELKFSQNDLIQPNPVVFAGNTVRNISGWGIQAGAPHSSLIGNVFRNCLSGGIYINGAKYAQASTDDESVEELSGYVEYMTISGNVIWIEDTVITDANNNANGILITEASSITVTNNVFDGNFYNIYLSSKSTKCVVNSNICRNRVIASTPAPPGSASTGQDIRVVGDASVESRHIINGNMTEAPVQLFDALANYVVINNVSTVAAGVGATPDATKYPEGVIVVNTSDTPDTVWLRYGASSILRIA